MKVNFNKIMITDIKGSEMAVSVSEDLGNTMYMKGMDIEECELGKTIYYADEEVELTEKQVSMVKRYLSRYSYVVRSAIEKQME